MTSKTSGFKNSILSSTKYEQQTSENLKKYRTIQIEEKFKNNPTFGKSSKEQSKNKSKRYLILDSQMGNIELLNKRVNGTYPDKKNQS